MLLCLHVYLAAWLWPDLGLSCMAAVVAKLGFTEGLLMKADGEPVANFKSYHKNGSLFDIGDENGTYSLWFSSPKTHLFSKLFLPRRKTNTNSVLFLNVLTMCSLCWYWIWGNKLWTCNNNSLSCILEIPAIGWKFFSKFLRSSFWRSWLIKI